jgi:hypothetical protein
MQTKTAWVTLATCFCFGQASAATIVDTFSISGAGITSSGTITLMTTGSPNVDEITGITGLFTTTNNGGFSGAITGLNPGSYSSSSPSIDSLAVWDNLFYPSEPAGVCSGTAAPNANLDFCGLDFLVAGGYEVNVFGNPFGSAAEGYFLTDGKSGGKVFNDAGALANFATGPSAVPEPASSSLLLTVIGFAICLMVRKRMAQRL